MVTHALLVAHYVAALRHWEGSSAVRALAAEVGLSRRLYCEYSAARQLDALAWTSGTGLDGNRAYDEALRHFAREGPVACPDARAAPD